ncbi:hypothetical protein Glove_334g16 [Diversispora epigaea]|uniref:SAM domain-containing protein n=1 Tax=Diversispora epigaea TaxID=1348612 RepID=A0A397HQX7_9GLOM|nr:hypothetical protein Glove_334g16 [Diversispora epigaea]
MFSPSSPISITEERPTRTMIFRKEEISGRAFLELTREDFRSIGFALRTATIFAGFANELMNKKYEVIRHIKR